MLSIRPLPYFPNVEVRKSLVCKNTPTIDFKALLCIQEPMVSRACSCTSALYCVKSESVSNEVARNARLPDRDPTSSIQILLTESTVQVNYMVLKTPPSH